MGGEAEPFIGDSTRSDTMAAAVDVCLERFGRIDVLLNNAGAGFFGSIEQTTEQDLDAMIAVNLKGVFHSVKAVLPVMRQQREGHIINVASTAGRRGSPYVGAYCASKFAVIGLTESLRVELLGSGIRVSLICPGATKTEFFAVARRRTHQHQRLVGPVESPERVADRIVAVVRRPKVEVLAQPVRRKAFLALNLIVPYVVDRLLARLINGCVDSLSVSRSQ